MEGDHGGHCDAVWSSKWLSTLQKHALPPSSDKVRWADVRDEQKTTWKTYVQKRW